MLKPGLIHRAAQYIHMRNFLDFITKATFFRGCVIFCAGLAVIALCFLISCMGITSVIEGETHILSIAAAGLLIIFLILLAAMFGFKSGYLYPGMLETKNIEQQRFGEEQPKDEP
jgi:cytochrome c biogenesis protein CcdA